MAFLSNNPRDPSTVTHELLSRAHSPDSASRIYADKIQHRPLFLKPSSPPPPDARDIRRRARQERQRRRAKLPKPRPLSAAQRRRLGLHDLPRHGQKYAVFEPLHRLWLGYVREILGGGGGGGSSSGGGGGGGGRGELYTGGQGAAAKLAAADFHGALVEVSRSRCPSRVGIRGIVVKDTRFVFELVTPRDQVKVVPKEGTVFRVDVPVGDGDGDGDKTRDVATTGNSDDRKLFTFEIHGDQFQHRAPDRSNKKFKAHFLKNI